MKKIGSQPARVHYYYALSSYVIMYAAFYNKNLYNNVQKKKLREAGYGNVFLMFIL